MYDVFISIFYIVIAVAIFIIPVLFRRILSLLQGILAILWIIYVVVTNLERIDFAILFLLPMWMFGSLLAVSLRSKEESEKGKKFHEEVYHSKG